MQDKIIQIAVIATRAGQPIDAGVPGLYEVSIPMAESDGLNLADVALESFHNTVAIASPENFEILAFDQATGAQLTPGFCAVDRLFDCKRTELSATGH